MNLCEGRLLHSIKEPAQQGGLCPGEALSEQLTVGPPSHHACEVAADLSDSRGTNVEVSEKFHGYRRKAASWPRVGALLVRGARAELRNLDGTERIAEDCSKRRTGSSPSQQNHLINLITVWKDT